MTALKNITRKRGNKKLLLIALCAAAVVAVTVAAVYLGWYFSPGQKLLRALDGEDLSELQQLYAQIEEAPEGFSEEVCKKLEFLSERYINGSLDYASADQMLRIYEEMNAPDTEDGLALCRQTLEKIKLSREAYVKGQSLEAAKDYPAAMESYAQVAEDDLWGWQNAQQKILDCQSAYRGLILQEAAAFAETEAYSEAMDKLREGLDILAEDEVLLAQLKTYTQADADKQRRDLLAMAEEYASNGDYPAAITLLEDCEEDEQLCAAYLSYCQEYADVTLSEAEEAFKLEGYEAAVEIIEKCLLTLPENEALLEAKAWYESYAPEYLSDYALTVSEGSKLYIDQHARDQKDNVYTHSLAANKGSISFRTNAEFTLLTGTLACPYGFEADSYRTGASVEIAADGVVIYQSPTITLESIPRHFQLDISGAQQITITWSCEGPNIWKNWGDRATIFDAALYRHGDE